MWIVTNRTPYVADASWLQDKDANKIWAVALKATFDVAADGSVRLAETQMPVLKLAQPNGEFGASSPAYAGDFEGLKPTTDILVKGSAWAPRGRPTKVVDIKLEAGPLRKHLRVHGNRRWQRGIIGPAASGAEPFESMPVQYEKAFGGWDRADPDPTHHRLDARNSVGVGFYLSAAHALGGLLPNVESAAEQIEQWDDRPTPAGLNGIDLSWSPRREWAGTYDEAWRRQRFPLWALDYDPRHASAAPVDQRTAEFWRGGESMRVAGMTVQGDFNVTLPRIYPFFRTRFGRQWKEHRGRLVSVIVEPDVRRVIMVWQSHLVCNRRVDELDETVVSEKQMVLRR